LLESVLATLCFLMVSDVVMLARWLESEGMGAIWDCVKVRVKGQGGGNTLPAITSSFGSESFCLC